MKIVYAPSALRDLEELLGFVNSRSPSGARKLTMAIRHAVEMCARYPWAAARTDEHNVYRRPLGRYKYTFYYRVLPEADRIEVVRTFMLRALQTWTSFRR